MRSCYNVVLMAKATARSMKEFPLVFIQEALTLATSGFGLVVALAWNEFVKDLISLYIQPFFGESSGIISKFIYAIVMTFLAVLVTMQLVRVEQTLGYVLEKNEYGKKPEKALKTKSKKK